MAIPEVCLHGGFERGSRGIVGIGCSRTGVSASTVSCLKEAWSGRAQGIQLCSLRSEEYVYLWVDGVHFGAPWKMPLSVCSI